MLPVSGISLAPNKRVISELYGEGCAPRVPKGTDHWKAMVTMEITKKGRGRQ